MISYILFFSTLESITNAKKRDAFLSLSFSLSLSYFFCLFQHSVPYLLQRSPEVSRVRPRAKWAVHPAASADTPIRRIAESTTYASRASPGNMVARSAPSSRSATPTVAALARTPKTFPDGEQFLICIYATLSWDRHIPIMQEGISFEI